MVKAMSKSLGAWYAGPRTRSTLLGARARVCLELLEVAPQVVTAPARLRLLPESRTRKVTEPEAWKCLPKAEAGEEAAETLLPEISTLGRGGSRPGRSSSLVLRNRVIRL